MLNFDSFTLVPAYSDIPSRSEIDISTLFAIEKNRTRTILSSQIPIINANMLSICTPEMVNVVSQKYNSFSSYHRFFESEDMKRKTISKIIDSYEGENNRNFLSKFWMSIGTKTSEYEFIEWLAKKGVKNIIIDVNHGHHAMVKDMLAFLNKNYPEFIVMAGNVSSNDGIKFLRDAGADIIKIGNSYGNSCSTQKMTGFGVTALHCAKTYRDATNDYETKLCADGGIRASSDIAKSLIWADCVMIGSMLAGAQESNGTLIQNNGIIYKEFFGNASARTKQVISEQNTIKFIEGVTKLVNYTGPLSVTLDNIVDGLRSAFSFSGARTLAEYQRKAKEQILMI